MFTLNDPEDTGFTAAPVYPEGISAPESWGYSDEGKPRMPWQLIHIAWHFIMFTDSLSSHKNYVNVYTLRVPDGSE